MIYPLLHDHNNNPLKIHTDKFSTKNSLTDIFGSDPKHLTISRNLWSFITWDADEVPDLADNKNTLQKIDSLVAEMLNTDRKTTVHPTQIQLINGMIDNRKLIFDASLNNPNILTNTGMTEMAKRSTGETSSTNTHHGIGIGTTAESLAQTALISEVGRKVIGERAVANQTERYGSAFAASDVTNLPRAITEGALFTALTNGIMVLRVTSEAQNLDTGTIITVQTNVSHLNGTEV